jgi:hypothetical protein
VRRQTATGNLRAFFWRKPMFYPKCPKCGGTTESAESSSFERGSQAAGNILRSTAHRHPYLQMAHLTVKVGREIYKRVPGGGEKQCQACGHRFH